MLYYAAMLFVVTMIAALIGFGGVVAGAFALVPKAVAVTSLVLFMVAFVRGLTT